jgi:hypothetical protein
MELTQNIKKGKYLLSKSKIILCSIVRDCEKNLFRNIKLINALCDLALDFNIIVFENDSKDNTKGILKKWASEQKNVYINLIDLNVGKTIPDSLTSGINPFFSRLRIDKMATYRNQYLDYIEKMDISGDFLIVVDLDVECINLEGIIDSFGQEREWDAITANGYSVSPKLTKRYHDTYALVECGCQNKPQTRTDIKENQKTYSFLRNGMPLINVYSAFGGLVIYKFDIIKGLRYKVLPNHDNEVEVKCEHFGFNDQIQSMGHHNFFINPNMGIKYQKISILLIYRFILRKFKR